jgi:hypothetical protein
MTSQQRPGISADVSEQLIGTAPEPIVGRHGHHQMSAGPQHPPDLPQGLVWVLQVLDHIQQRHRRD